MQSHSDYVPLHLHTEYSLLDGAIKIDELVRAAEAYRLPALAITDHGNIFGAIEFYQKVSKAGIKPIIGCEVYVAPESRFNKKRVRSLEAKVTVGDVVGGESNSCGEEYAYHLILLARDISGYKNLMRLITKAHLEGFYYKPRIDDDLLEQYSGGLIALSSCMKGEIPSLLLKGDIDSARRRAIYYKNLFSPENFYLELQANGIPEQQELNKKIYELAEEVHLGVVATNDCHYLRREDARAHEILLCIQTNKTIKDKDRMRFQTDEFYFKSPEEMKHEFAHIPEAIHNTIVIAERCNLILETNKALLPEFITPDNSQPDEFLERIAVDGLKRRFSNAQVPEAYRLRLKEELNMIRKMGYSSYFLIVWDFIRFAKERGIPVGPGRGSAAGSLVAWALGITEIDPIKYNLLFERFLNPERVSMPDIDVDFCRDRREEVIQYVQQKYGADHVAQIITFGTMAARAVVRDVGRVLGMPYQEVDRIAKLIPVSVTKEINLKKAIDITPPLKEVYEGNSQVRELLDIAMRLEGLSRHASVHAAGVVIAPEPLTEYTALYKGSKGDETITTQFDLESIEKIGLVKFDFLGLDTLTIIDNTVKYVRERSSKDFDINTIPLDDELTYRLLSSGRTIGVFQLESSGMRELLVKMEPDRFEDLVALVALYRPGPLGSGMVDDFIKRKKGLVPVNYELPELRDILDETYGVILYQEQVMRISNKIAGFTMGQADILRRAISKKDPFLMEELKTKFIHGALERGYPEETAKRLFELIEYFGNYGFNKSHSAAYALLAYQTAYLKAHYPVEFMAASLSAEIDKTDKVVRLINECREMGIEVLPPDINKSDEGFTIELVEKKTGAIRFGLKAVKGVGGAAIELIKEERKKGDFKSFEDFLRRLLFDGQKRLNKKVVEALIKAGAFDSLGISRKSAFKELESALEGRSSPQKLSYCQANMFDFPSTVTSPQGTFTLATSADGLKEDNSLNEPSLTSVAKVTVEDEWDELTRLSAEREVLGFYISGHPVQSVRSILKAFGVRSTSELFISPPKSTVPFATNEEMVDETVTGDLQQLQETVTFSTNIGEDIIVSDGEITVAGLITEIKKHRTKGKNELMAFITVEDEEGTLEAVIFPELYKSSFKILEKGSLVILRGKVDSSERGIKIIAEEISDLESFIKKTISGTTRIQLKLNKKNFNKEALYTLRAMLGGESNFSTVTYTSPGGEVTFDRDFSIPLYVEFKMPDCVITLQSRFRLRPELGIFKKIQDCLGKNSMEVIR
jgi:DNA polymerase-3 subunit alpha